MHVASQISGPFGKASISALIFTSWNTCTCLSGNIPSTRENGLLIVLTQGTGYITVFTKVNSRILPTPFSFTFSWGQKTSAGWETSRCRITVADRAVWENQALGTPTQMNQHFGCHVVSLYFLCSAPFHFFWRLKCFLGCCSHWNGVLESHMSVPRGPRNSRSQSYSFLPI